MQIRRRLCQSQPAYAGGFCIPNMLFNKHKKALSITAKKSTLKYYYKIDIEENFKGLFFHRMSSS